MMLLLLALQQAAAPTVGDTLWVSRRIPLGQGEQVRLADWNPEGEVQLLGTPAVVMTGAGAEIRYPLVAWAPGSHRVEIPGPIVIHPSGAEDTLGLQVVTLEVASILPRGVPESSLAIQPPATPVLRRLAHPWPVLALAVLGVLLVLPLHWWWRRRGKPVPVVVPPAALPPEEAMLRRWAEVGEDRAVASYAAVELRGAIGRGLPSAHPGLDTPAVLAEIAAHRPAWPVQELGAVLALLDTVRFAPGALPSGESFGLYRRSAELARRLDQAPA